MLVRRSKWLWYLALLSLAALALGACAPQAAPSVAPTSPPAATPTQAAAVQPTTAAPATAAPTTAAPATPTQAPAVAAAGACGTLRILYWQAVTILNTHLAQGTKDYDAGRLVVEPLAAMTPEGVPTPILAAEIPTVTNGGVSADLTTVTWKLKQGVKWSDGTDFSADDVVFTHKYNADAKSATTDAGAFTNVKSVEAVDKYTVKLTWNAPNPNFYETFVTGLGNIIQKKQYEPFSGERSKEGPNLLPVGTGPFKVREMKPGDVVTYDMNPNYRDFAKGKPCFKEVIFKGGGDAASAAKAVFQTGEVDYAWNLQVEASVLVPMISDPTARANFITSVSPNVERLLLNRANPDAALGDKRSEPDQLHPFLSDLKVRQALKLAIDSSEMARQLYGPAGAGTCNILTSPPSIASKNTTCKADLAAANKLLDDAGWTKGGDGVRHKTVDGKDVKMNILFQTSVNSLRQKEQAFVKNAWEQLGIKVELKSVDAGIYFSSDEANPDTSAKFFADVEMFTNGATAPDPTNYLRIWTCAEIRTKAAKWSGQNYERACSKEYDALFEQLKKENDPAKRADIAIKMNDILMNDVVIIPLVARNSPVSGVSKALKGILPNPWDSEMWNIADWSK